MSKMMLAFLGGGGLLLKAPFLSCSDQFVIFQHEHKLELLRYYFPNNNNNNNNDNNNSKTKPSSPLIRLSTSSNYVNAFHASLVQDW